MLVTAEVQHPTRIGAQFVISGVQGVGEQKSTVRRAVRHFQLLAFHQITVRREQFHV